jgi:hypothetical protein
VAAAADGEGNVVLGSHIWFAVYNVRARTARTVNLTAPNMLMVSRHVFSESLVRHSSFAARSAADLGVTFSWGLVAPLLDRASSSFVLFGMCYQSITTWV